ncbi:hypothetical protein NP289_23155, partial [Salmonella enterica]|nr:hypothetical protein [Salmonella enterica]MCQ7912598.1 hypothetical protein [Salmonella enterica]MCQ7917117.1 hypothetical protein [Salmonella enterica]MCQ7921624.1 hypothetical protein [Salmonella enterica]
MTLAINEDCYAVDAWRRETFAPGTPADVTITERRLWAVAYSALFDHGLASKSDQRFASIRSTG